ncbi:MAG TPA: hypothetical protein VHD38_02670 [Candidatus Paceibacterota bacterium]|nr:hypothetical protein [Candidatus Paceibacterota bacterium]
MKAALALFNNHGREELRLYFPAWEVDGQTLKDVTVFPHPCKPEVCEYGDHVHIEVYEDDKLVRVIEKDHVTLTSEQEAAINAYLRAQLAVNQMTHDLLHLVGAEHTHTPTV